MQVSCNSQNHSKASLHLPLKKKKLGHIWPQWKLLSPHCNTTAQWNSPSKTQVFSWIHRKVFKAQGREGWAQVTCAYAQLQCKTLFCSAWSPNTSPFPRKVREETRLGRTVTPWLCQHHPRPHGPLGTALQSPSPHPSSQMFLKLRKQASDRPEEENLRKRNSAQKAARPTVARHRYSCPSYPQVRKLTCPKWEKNPHTTLSGNCTDFRWSAPWHLCPARLICACSATVAGRSQNPPLFQVCVGF